MAAMAGPQPTDRPSVDGLGHTLQAKCLDVYKAAIDLQKLAGLMFQEAEQERKEWAYRMSVLQVERQKIEEEKRQIIELSEEKQEELLQSISSQETEIHGTVEIIVSGRMFTTSTRTIASLPNSLLAEAVSLMLKELEENRKERGSSKKKKKLKLRIDRDPRHFELILNYLREADRSLHWLYDPEAMKMSDLEAVRDEADYYKLKNLARLVTWELVSRKPVVSSKRLPSVLKLDKFENAEAAPFYKTLQTVKLEEENFTETVFENIVFVHNQTFISCDFRGSVFRRCFFNNGVLMNLSGSNISGIKFIDCRCNSRMSPADVFIVDEDQKGNIPSR
ncbi:PREDICTED: uncharacterized protein LOC109580385 [Amphimedon queenslandica]|uniref:Potassium channel tetramerisation-type BTB domain-containing protein n=1 Tax=Amphimedon queenslandica TaxID=400682 RepID=A0A1X7VGJ2_AMPQE|nr:PREDICTED: uncharacterized protein LOC109580385 [Amphimedon queenslandica]|eukprot:XP_019849016.1 PREDICTED: uncharacterized protein LOC109580385 [Amphimedon queenslandica]